MERDLRITLTTITEFLGLVLIFCGYAAGEYVAMVAGLVIVAVATWHRKRNRKQEAHHSAHPQHL